MKNPNGTAPVQSERVAPTEQTDFDAAFDRAFGVVAFVMNRTLIDYMLRSARRFDADYETLVIWGVLGHQNAAHLLPPGGMPSAILDESGRTRGGDKLRPMKLRDISAITGIPRETARRKLERLRHAGWIQKVEEGWQIDVNSIDPDLREFTRESARRFLAAASDLTTAMKDSANALRKSDSGH